MSSVVSHCWIGIAACLFVAAAVANAQSAAPPQSGGDQAKQDPPPAQTGAQEKFDVWEYRVLGNSVLGTRDIERTVYPYLGAGKTLKDVEAARLALETAYHQSGYGTVFVDLPEQTVAEGIVRLKVTEGVLRRAQVSGARYFSGREIKAALPEARAASVPHLPSLQDQLIEVNSVTSDRRVTPVLKAGPLPGTVDLTLRVDDHLPFHGSVELNNAYTVDTSSLRALLSLSYDNLFGRFDSLSMQYQTSPADRRQVDVLSSTYVAHFHAFRWATYFLHSNSQVATLGAAATGSTGPADLLVVGRGNAYGTRFMVPLLNTEASTQNLTFGAEYKNFLQTVGNRNPTVPTDPNAPAGLATPISYVNVSIDYGGFWRGTNVQTSFDTSANFSVRGLRSDATQFDDKRFHARPNYFYVRSATSFGARLPADFTLLMRASGQYAVEPLVSNEEFSIAGGDGVRGYLEAELLADRAVKASAQLGSPRWSLPFLETHADAFLFFDYGKIALIDALPGEPADIALRSWGAGLNLVLHGHLTGFVTWAYPLVDAVTTRAGQGRILFSLRGTW